MKRIVLLIETSRAFGRQLIMGIARYSKLHGPWSFYKEPTDLKSSIPHLTSWKPDGIIMRDSLESHLAMTIRKITVLLKNDWNQSKYNFISISGTFFYTDNDNAEIANKLKIFDVN